MSTTAGVYAQGTLDDLTSEAADALKGSGFTTIFWFCLHVDAAGDLMYNSNISVATGGQYVGPSGWSDALSGLKQGTTSVNRLLFTVGGAAPSSDFTNIQKILQDGPTSAAYQNLQANFQALGQVLPAIDGIDFDDETLLDQDTIVGFANLLNGLGYQVTFCPYQQDPTDMGIWVDSLYALNSVTPGLVTQFNLQCYGGGAGNTPKPWIDAIAAKMGTGFDAEGFVFPGLICNSPTSDPSTNCRNGHCPDAVTRILESWAKEDALAGAFIWRYEQIPRCAGQSDCSGTVDAAAYASAIQQALGMRV